MLLGVINATYENLLVQFSVQKYPKECAAKYAKGDLVDVGCLSGEWTWMYQLVAKKPDRND